jgi:hypothetical protein
MTATREWYSRGLWAEYDSAADWCAARGLKGVIGDALPTAISSACLIEINADPDAFERRVRECAYARAMNALNLPVEG